MAQKVPLDNPEALKRWLSDKPSPWSFIIAIRMALRVLPLVNQETKSSSSSSSSKTIVSFFQSYCLSWAAYRFSIRYIINTPFKFSNTMLLVIASCINVAARSAVDGVDTASAIECFQAVSAAQHTIQAAYPGDIGKFWKQIARDVFWLEAQAGNDAPSQATKLAEQPLWHEDAPQSLQTDWNNFKLSALASDHGFQPWIRWYEAIAPFDARTAPRDLFSEGLTRRIASQPSDWWERPALDINTDIARWLEEDTATPLSIDDLPAQLTEALDQLPSQQPAPYLFDWRDGRMEVLPPEPLPEDGGIAQDFLDETREKAHSLFERLERTNTDPDIRRKVGKLLDVLTERVADLRPALVKSRSLSITALADAHNTPQDERELSAGVLADLIDLDLTAKELCASLPDLARQEIERLVDAMASVEDAEAARSGLDAIRLSAEEAEILGPAAQAALAGLSEDAAEPAAPALKKRRVALLMATVRNLLLKALRVPGTAVKATAGALWRFMKDSGKEFRGLLVKGTAYGLLVAAGTAPIYFVATQTEAISVVARYAEGFKDIEQILKLAGRLKTPPE